MKILFSYGLVGRGGDALQVQIMASTLAQLGHDVRLVGATRLSPYEFRTSAAGLRGIARTWPWWARDILGLMLQVRNGVLLRLAARRESPDLVIHRVQAYDTEGKWLARSYPVIAHLDAPYAVERASHGEGLFRSLHKRTVRSATRWARLVVVPSAETRDHYARVGIPTEKVLIMPNGILREHLERGTEAARLHPPLSGDAPYTLGFVGCLSHWHRVDRLLEVLERLNRASPEAFRLRIVGRGEAYDSLLRLSARLGLDGCVEFLGAVSHERALEAISTFDVAVLPNTLSTGSPMKLLEYAAMGRPTVAPDLPNLRAIFSDDEIRFFSPEQDDALTEAILDLAGHPDKARELGRNAQDATAKYTWESILEDVLEAALTTR